MADNADGINDKQQTERRRVPFAPAHEPSGQCRERQGENRHADERMRDAAVPGENEEIVVREKVAEDVGVREDRTEHQRPRDDALAIHRLCAEHVLPAEGSLGYKCAGDTVRDGVHPGSLADLPRLERISAHSKQRRTLGEDSADTPRGNAVALQPTQSGIRNFRSDCYEQAAGSLRVEEQILIFGSDVWSEAGAVADKRAIVLESAGKMSFARRFHSAREIVERGMIDFKGHRRNAMRRIAQRHLPRVAQQTKSGDIGYRVNVWRAG